MPVVFGWVFASRQVGPALAAWGGVVIRDVTASYDPAWYAADGLCLLPSALSTSIRLLPPAAVPPSRRPNPPGL